ncbi:unnamed protein product [Bathycoccus prasinos]
MTVPFNKFIVKKCSRMRFQLLFFLILATMLFKLASILSIEYLGEEDCKILPKELYTLIQSRTDAAFHHGYRRVSRCGQYFYLDEMKNFKNGELISPSAEKYAETLKSKKGTGYIDFQYPDAVSETVDHGYVFFPFVSNCRGGETREPYEIFLSTMITADGFRPALFDFFLEYYSEVGVSFENMLFTIQLMEQGYNFANGLFLDRIAISGCRLHKRLSLGTPKKDCSLLVLATAQPASSITMGNMSIKR